MPFCIHRHRRALLRLFVPCAGSSSFRSALGPVYFPRPPTLHLLPPRISPLFPPCPLPPTFEHITALPFSFFTLLLDLLVYMIFMGLDVSLIL